MLVKGKNTVVIVFFLSIFDYFYFPYRSEGVELCATDNIIF